MKKFAVVFLVFVIVLLLSLAWFIWRQQVVATRAPESSGVVEATKVMVSSRLNARLVAMMGKEGDTVKAGELLAELDCADINAQVQAAEARYAATQAQMESLRAQAEGAQLQAQAAKQTSTGHDAQVGALRVQEARALSEMKRAQALFRDKVIDASSLEAVQTTLDDLRKKIESAQSARQASIKGAAAAGKQTDSIKEQATAAEQQSAAAEAEMQRAITMQRECRVVAPIDGVVTVRAREPGEVVLPGALIYELRQSGSLFVKFYIRNASLGNAKFNSRVRVVADAFPDKEFTGVIRRIAEEAEFTPRNVQTRSDRDRLVYAAEATIDNADDLLRPGMPIEVYLLEPAQ